MPNFPRPHPTVSTLESLRAMRGTPPFLFTKDDSSATRESIRNAARKAIDGDDEAAVALGRVAKNSLISPKNPDLSANEASRAAFPEGFRNDALYWLGLACERGDSLAQLTFANAVASAERNKNNPQLSFDASKAETAAKLARKYLQAAIEAGVADGLKMLSAAYREGLLGLASDTAKAHASLLVLAELLSSEETFALVRFDEGRLGEDDVAAANRIAAAGAVWKIGPRLS